MFEPGNPDDSSRLWLPGEGVEDDCDRTTRTAFLQRMAAGGTALVFGGGFAASRLIGPDGAFARTTKAKPDGIHHFHSRPDLVAPIVSVLHAGKTGDGYVFIAPSSGPGARGPMIFDNRGEIIWFHPTKARIATNFRTALYKGQPVLTWWEGTTSAGLGVGSHVIFNSSYKQIANFPAGGGRQSDLHEFQITSHGTALVSSYETKYMDLRPYGGSRNSKVIGGVFQEIEIPSAKVLFEWRSLDHVTLDESHQRPGANFFDYFHINSIDIDSDGNYLVSARSTWAVYKIARKTGKVIWRLGGKKSDFSMGKGTVFAWQHDARHHTGGKEITIFDDGGAPTVEPQSRILVIALDLKRKQATLARKYTHHPGRLQAHFMGNAQVLPNGNVIAGWGGEPYITEWNHNGRIEFDAKLPRGGQNYRAFRFPWVGHPSKPPRIGSAGTGSARRVYASWNGATEVAAWQLLTGTTAANLTPAGTTPKAGFETALVPRPGSRYAAAVALDTHGKPLHRSSTFKL